jgi:hypothetical protein
VYLSITVSETAVLSACRTLFGARLDVSNDFLWSLHPDDVRSAYRRRAKETHPDLFYHKDPFFQKRQSDLFRRVSDSYTVVQEFFKQRDTGRWRSATSTVNDAQHKERTYTRTTTSRSEANTCFHHGTVPSFHLEIGRYLYYRGVIPYSSLIKALSWQRRQRPIIGSIAMRWGWLDQHTIGRILNYRCNGRIPMFGERGIQLGLFTPYQVRIMLVFQRSQQKKFGQYFVENGMISQRELEQLVLDMKEHNARVWRPQVAM